MQKPTASQTGVGGVGFALVLWILDQAGLDIPPWAMLILGVVALGMVVIGVASWVKNRWSWFREYTWQTPIVRRSQKLTTVQPNEIWETYFRRRSISIRDLIEADGSAISERTFEDCFIDGPAVIYPLRTTFDAPTFQADIPEAIFWELSADQEAVYGAIEVRDCMFRRCRFSRIGVTGPPEMIKAIRREVTRELGGKERTGE